VPEPYPTAAARGTAPIAEGRLASWAASLGVFALALFLRLWHLGTPREFAFDETYYAKDAWSLLHHGYVRNYAEDADKEILAGHTLSQWGDGPSMTVHPDVGKWLIALGEKAFGMDPFGWRVASAVVGSLMILLMVRFARRITGSTLLGVLAGLLLCLDGLQLVLSRMALLDIFLAFFLLLAVHCVVADRQWFRTRLMTHGRQRLLFRPWLLAAGVSFGLACGTKWTAIWPLAVFGLVVWLWSAGARRATGTRLAIVKSAFLDGITAFVHLVGVALLVYVASWGGWLAHAHEYEEHLSATQYHRFQDWDGTCTGEGDEAQMKDVEYDDDRVWPTAEAKDAEGLGEVVQSLHSLWLYHRDVYTFHTEFLNCSTHTYASDPGGWVLLSRPVSASVVNDIKPGTDDCNAAPDSHCIREVLILGTPLLWWAGTAAIVASAVIWLGRRDWRHGVAVIGFLATWLPWQLNDERPIFSFYASAFSPFLVLSLVLIAGHLLGPSRGPSPRRTAGTIVVGTFLVLVLVNFAWFWPIWTGELLTLREWQSRMWFSRWI
jgi:dolichyl-phosphate-mannose--protein O-mannosyl transferase